jgi:uncharacterized protein (TIGR02466 family)
MDEEVQILPILAQPLFCSRHPDPDEITQLFASHLKEESFSTNPRSENIKHYDQSKFLDQPEFKKFKQWILDSALLFSNKILLLTLEEDQPLIMTDYWLNQMDEGSSLPPHNHANSLISGTYYLNHEKNHSPLVFTQLRETESNTINPYIKQQQDHNNIWTGDQVIQVETGALLLWESALVHGSYQNKADNRLSISFNIMPRVLKDHSHAHKFEIVPLQ